MAADKHSPNRARVRKRQRRSNRPETARRQGQPARRRNARLKPAPSQCPEPLHLQEHMEGHIRTLNLIMSAIVVSIAALRRQNCDIDEDIARVLERSAADQLDIAIENLAAQANCARGPCTIGREPPIEQG